MHNFWHGRLRRSCRGKEFWVNGFGIKFDSSTIIFDGFFTLARSLIPINTVIAASLLYIVYVNG
ncbi:hypothetical protein [Moorena producens]|uniref:hypothetical protein n=1 Tax=Moorena producens TaxID=1155739 RepID=UPI003C70FEC0